MSIRLSDRLGRRRYWEQANAFEIASASRKDQQMRACSTKSVCVCLLHDAQACILALSFGNVLSRMRSSRLGRGLNRIGTEPSSARLGSRATSCFFLASSSSSIASSVSRCTMPSEAWSRCERNDKPKHELFLELVKEGKKERIGGKEGRVKT